MNDYTNATRCFGSLLHEPAGDYTYPSVFFAYLFFALMFLLAVFFFIKTLRDGYWGEHSEDAKYRMLDDHDTDGRKHE